MLGRLVSRQHPLLQVEDFCRLNYDVEYQRLILGQTYKKKLLCLETQRGRSVTKLTRRSRLQFRQLLINHQCYGVQPSSW